MKAHISDSSVFYLRPTDVEILRASLTYYIETLKTVDGEISSKNLPFVERALSRIKGNAFDLDDADEGALAAALLTFGDAIEEKIFPDAPRSLARRVSELYEHYSTEIAEVGGKVVRREV